MENNNSHADDNTRCRLVTKQPLQWTKLGHPKTTYKRRSGWSCFGLLSGCMWWLHIKADIKRGLTPLSMLCHLQQLQGWTWIRWDEGGFALFQQVLDLPGHPRLFTGKKVDLFLHCDSVNRLCQRTPSENIPISSPESVMQLCKGSRF